MAAKPQAEWIDLRYSSADVRVVRFRGRLTWAGKSLADHNKTSPTYCSYHTVRLRLRRA